MQIFKPRKIEQCQLEAPKSLIRQVRVAEAYAYIYIERARSGSVRDLEKGVNSKLYPRLCNARRPRLEPRTFRSQAVRLYCLHQALPSPLKRTKKIFLSSKESLVAKLIVKLTD